MTTIILAIIGMLLAAAAALMGGVVIDIWPRLKACLRKIFASRAAPLPLPFIIMVVGLIALIIDKACRLYFLFMRRRTLLHAQRLGRHLCNPPQTWAAP